MQQALSRNRLGATLTAVVLVAILSGCAGGLLGMVLQLVTVGKLVGDVQDLKDRFFKDPDEYQVFFDGYLLGKRPEKSGELELDGLPSGRHLISVIDEDYRTGFHQSVEITPGQAGLQLSDYNALEGAVISGKVERQAGGGRVGVADLLVVAVFDGASALRENGGVIITIPPTDDTTYVMGYTNSAGNYRLGPCAYGSWLVTTALPGYYADARVLVTSAGSDGRNEDLYLAGQPLDNSATVLGSVTQNGLEGLADALVYTDLDAAYEGQLTAERATEVENLAGFSLIDGPWFAWTRLGTVSDAAGAYSLRTNTGQQTIIGFKYGYQAKAMDLNLGPDDAFQLDFDLSRP